MSSSGFFFLQVIRCIRKDSRLMCASSIAKGRRRQGWCKISVPWLSRCLCYQRSHGGSHSRDWLRLRTSLLKKIGWSAGMFGKCTICTGSFSCFSLWFGYVMHHRWERCAVRWANISGWEVWSVEPRWVVVTLKWELELTAKNLRTFHHF